MLIAIETSCDETAVSLIDLDSFNLGKSVEDYLKADIVASQVKLHSPYGGVVPELAAREHMRNLPLVVDEALKKAQIRVEKLSAVAVTRGPGLKGCLLVGLSFAKALAFSRKIPLLTVNHLEGHVYAGELLEKAQRPPASFLALLVSGGHTQLVLVKDFRKYQLIADTRDDAAGEAFDKVASLLNLPYPGGPSLSKRAMDGDRKSFSFPIALKEDSQSFSFSGLKTAVLRTVQSLKEKGITEKDITNLSAAVESTIAETLIIKTLNAAVEHNVKSVLLTGGVAANEHLRLRLGEELSKKGIALSVPPRKWCTDNAAMIGVLAARIIQNAGQSFFNVEATSATNLEFQQQCRARWPLMEINS